MATSELKRHRSPDISRLSERGFFSLEMIIVLVIALSILAMSATRIGDLFAASDSNSAANNVMSLNSAVRGLRSTAGYGSDGTDLLNLLRLSNGIPSSLTISGDAVLNEWAQPISIVSLNSGQGFSITYPGVPQKVCTQLSTQFLSSGTFSGITINGTMLQPTASLSEIVNASNGSTHATMIFLVNAS